MSKTTEITTFENMLTVTESDDVILSEGADLNDFVGQELYGYSIEEVEFDEQNTCVSIYINPNKIDLSQDTVLAQLTLETMKALLYVDETGTKSANDDIIFAINEVMNTEVLRDRGHAIADEIWEHQIGGISPVTIGWIESFNAMTPEYFSEHYREEYKALLSARYGQAPESDSYFGGWAETELYSSDRMVNNLMDYLTDVQKKHQRSQMKRCFGYYSGLRVSTVQRAK